MSPPNFCQGGSIVSCNQDAILFFHVPDNQNIRFMFAILRGL